MLLFATTTTAPRLLLAALAQLQNRPGHLIGVVVVVVVVLLEQVGINPSGKISVPHAPLLLLLLLLTVMLLLCATTAAASSSSNSSSSSTDIRGRSSGRSRPLRLLLL